MLSPDLVLAPSASPNAEPRDRVARAVFVTEHQDRLFPASTPVVCAAQKGRSMW